IDGQFDNVTARKDIAFILKLNLPRFRSGSELQVGIMQWQQETMIELLTNLPCKPFQHREIKTKLCSFDLPPFSTHNAKIWPGRASDFPPVVIKGAQAKARFTPFNLHFRKNMTS